MVELLVVRGVAVPVTLDLLLPVVVVLSDDGVAVQLLQQEQSLRDLSQHLGGLGTYLARCWLEFWIFSSIQFLPRP